MRGARDAERLQAIEKAVDRLREVAESGTVVVEGSRDLGALDWLGIGGHHVALHRGDSLARVVEDLVQCPRPVVLLMDWDRTGGRMQAKLAEGLHARVPVDQDARRRLAQSCHSKTLEEVPAELEALRRAVHGGRFQGFHG